MTKINKKELLDDLKILYGLPPHDSMSNYCQGDGYYANSLVKKYGQSIEELKNSGRILIPHDEYAWKAHQKWMSRHEKPTKGMIKTLSLMRSKEN